MQMMNVVDKRVLPQANVMLSRRDSGDVNLPYDMERGLLLTSNPCNALKAQNWRRTIAGPVPCLSRLPLGALGYMPEAGQGALSQTGFDDIRAFDMLAGILTHLDSRSDYNMFFVTL
jgi:hypothetical protein